MGIRELVSYQGVLSKQDAIIFQQKASIGLVPFLPVGNFMASMANRLSEYMALGLPLVSPTFLTTVKLRERAARGSLLIPPTRNRSLTLLNFWFETRMKLDEWEKQGDKLCGRASTGTLRRQSS